jgi:cytosine/adenosine deaminase-related metal-dependent hydrolase
VGTRLNEDLIRTFAEAGDRPVSLRARWVFPVWGAPLENATVEITAGRISAVHDLRGASTIDLGNVAVIPGLVNAHTHLDLSDISAPLQPALPFTSWLKTVIGHRRERSQAVIAETRESGTVPDSTPVAGGRAESAAWGTTTIADIAGAGWNPAELSEQGPAIVSFLELLGLSPEQRDAQLDRARAHLMAGSGTRESSDRSSLPEFSRLQQSSKPSPARGLSPHAPYSVHPDLLRGLVDLAVHYRAPVAMHLAETRSELELLSKGTGEFVPFLESMGVWRADAIPRGSRPLDYLRELARVENALAIHGNYLSDEEIDFLATHPNISVIYCPRTHAFFKHDPHPWLRLLERGINVALGTDSRASNPDLGLWNELLFLRASFPAVDPALLLRAGTWNGAFALDRETGSLEIGKSADLAIVSLAAGTTGDPHSLLFRPENRVFAAICAGRAVVVGLPTEPRP